MLLCIINNIYDSFLAVRIKPVRVAYLTFDYLTISAKWTENLDARSLGTRDSGRVSVLADSILYLPYVKYL